MNREQAAQERIDICRAYRSLFLDGNQNIKPEAEVILRDLEKETGWMVTALPTTRDGSIDPLRVAADLEKRRIYAHIKKRLFEPLGDMKRILETE
jgi:hypothetical protein